MATLEATESEEVPGKFVQGDVLRVHVALRLLSTHPLGSIRLLPQALRYVAR